MRGPQSRTDDRATSIAVTHVLTIGITTVLVTGLLIGAGTMLETERDRSSEASLETIGERLAGEISSVDRLAATDRTTTVTTNHQRVVAGSAYTAELREDCGGEPSIGDGVDCITLQAHDTAVDVAVPLTVDSALVDGSSARGGAIEIAWNGTHIALQNGDP